MGVASVVESVEAVDNNADTGAVAKDAIQAAVGTTNAIAGAAVQSVTNPVAAIGATQAAVTESATKLAHALDSVNPLSNLIPTSSQVSVLQLQSRELNSPIVLFEQDQQGILGNILHPKLPGL